MWSAEFRGSKVSNAASDRVPLELPVREFSRRTTFTASVDLVARVMVTAVLLTFLVACWSTGLFPLIFLALVLFCINLQFWGWAGIGHEYFHGTVFRSRRTNRALFLFCGILTFRNPGYFAATHLRHHRSPLSDEDPENQSGKLIVGFGWLPLCSFDVLAFWRNLKNLVINALGRVPGQKETLDLSAVELRRIRSGARWVLAMHLSSWLIGLESGYFLFAVLFTLAPFAFGFLQRSLELAQHGGLPPSNDAFESTRSIVLWTPLSWAYGRMNFHTEHHFAPFVPFYRLKSFSDDIVRRSERDHREYGLRQVFRVASGRL